MRVKVVKGSKGNFEKNTTKRVGKVCAGSKAASRKKENMNASRPGGANGGGGTSGISTLE